MDTNNLYGTLDLQKKLLILLKDFNKFCLHNGINYSLAYGSLLGAIRHQGFIPWDDDLDIMLTRREFEKLLNALKKQNIFDVDYQTASSLWILRIKEEKLKNALYPPTIDVFIIDNVPNNFILARIKLILMYIIREMCKKNNSIKNGNLFMKICSFICWCIGCLLPQNFKWNFYDKISKIGNESITDYIACYNTIFKYLKKKWKSSVISETTLMKFEDFYAPVMKGYDEFLKVHYGDYMKLPKVKLGHHIHSEIDPTTF